jgi:hypothetical protein
MEVGEGPSSKVLLRHVELKLFHQGGKTFDRVRSASAEFDKDDGALFSDGAVEITLAMPVDPVKQGRLLTIRSSGVRFEAATGKASTDRAAQFSFDLGDGQAVGAVYDPATRELQLLGEVLLNWRGRDDKRPMKIEAGTAVYKEA